MVGCKKRLDSYSVFNSGLMLRLGKTEEIEKQFYEGYLRFGCPANWINYANIRPEGIADKYEGVFAHVKNNDPLLSALGDDGVPLNRYRSLWNDEGPDNTLYVRYIFSCLVPTICFYSIDLKDVARHFGMQNQNKWWLKINLQPYYKAMGIKPEESSVLIIRYPGKLVEELKREIPNAVRGARNIENRDFDVNNPLAIRYVQYNLDITKLFWDLNPYDELFRKRPEYKEQHEARIIIPNASFVRDPVSQPEKYNDNEMIVPVPGIMEYASICEVSKCKSIQLIDISEDMRNYTVCFHDEK
jgi:hypothetical protein